MKLKMMVCLLHMHLYMVIQKMLRLNLLKYLKKMVLKKSQRQIYQEMILLKQSKMLLNTLGCSKLAQNRF